MKLTDREWNVFFLKDFFTVERGTRLTENNRIQGLTPLITAGFNNSGVASYISNKEMKIYKNKITIDMFCNCFYRNYEFCCDDNILLLFPKFKFNYYILKFFVTEINQNKNNYGKQYRQKTFNKHSIYLPINSLKNPDYKFMEIYMKEIEKKQIEKYKKHLKNRIIPERERERERE